MENESNQAVIEQITVAVNTAVQLHNAGRLDEAETLYKQILQVVPSHPIVLHYLGVIAYQSGRNEAAVDFIKQALVIQPDNPEAHQNLGSALKAQGKLEEAIQSYRKALDINPGLIAAYFNLGNAYKDLKRFDDSISSFQAALSINPDNGDAHTNLGNVYKDKGMLEDALKSYNRSLEINPDFAEGHYNRASILHGQHKYEEAVEAFKSAIEFKPNYAEAYCNLGSTYEEMEKPDAALECYEKALSIDPQFAAAHSNLGVIYKNQWRLEEAEECYRKALQINPDYADAHSNMGNVHKEYGRLDEAEDSYRKALALDDRYYEAYRNLGLTQLLRGDYEQGWRNHALRWREKKDHNIPSRVADIPLWRGETLRSGTSSGGQAEATGCLLVWMEQGVGDEIMFAGMIPDLVKIAPDLIVECEERLLDLFRRSFPTVTFVARQNAPDRYLSAYQIGYQVPAGNLCEYLRSDITKFPRQDSYLVPDHDKVEAFRNTYLTLWPEKKRIGIAWETGTLSSAAKRRLPLPQWAPLICGSNHQFINLQYGDVTDDLEGFQEQFGVPIYRDPSVNALLDIETFAAQVAALDLVISIDNSTVHVAGSLGIPTWLMLPFAPEYRWLLDRSDCVWYDSVRLYRQPALGDWDSVIRQVDEDLKNV